MGWDLSFSGFLGKGWMNESIQTHKPDGKVWGKTAISNIKVCAECRQWWVWSAPVVSDCKLDRGRSSPAGCVLPLFGAVSPAGIYYTCCLCGGRQRRLECLFDFPWHHCGAGPAWSGGLAHKACCYSTACWFKVRPQVRQVCSLMETTASQWDFSAVYFI